jgi:hypothetical protein
MTKLTNRAAQPTSFFHHVRRITPRSQLVKLGERGIARPASRALGRSEVRRQHLVGHAAQLIFGNCAPRERHQHPILCRIRLLPRWARAIASLAAHGHCRHAAWPASQTRRLSREPGASRRDQSRRSSVFVYQHGARKSRIPGHLRQRADYDAAGRNRSSEPRRTQHRGPDRSWPRAKRWRQSGRQHRACALILMRTPRPAGLAPAPSARRSHPPHGRRH